MTYNTILEALGDPTRRFVFDRLAAQGPSPVAALAAGLPVSRPAVSQHLKILKEAGLVRDDVAGTRRIYRIDRQGLAALRDWLDGLETLASHAYQAELKRQLDERKST